jgi:hypothetical protein
MRCALVICGILAAASPAAAAPFAYATAENGDFGVLDLGSGAYVHCGYNGTILFGLAALENGPLYGMDDAYFYRANPHTGALTKIARAGNYLVAFGSTAHTIYAVDSIADLYTVDPETGVETAVGKAAPAGVDFVFVISSGALTLYETTSAGLYDYIPRQGVAHRKDRDSSVEWGGLALVDGVLYGVGMPTIGDPTQNIYAISTLDGTMTLVATVSSALSRVTGLAPTPPDNTGTCRADQ